jgi:hypothetical protein
MVYHGLFQLVILLNCEPASNAGNPNSKTWYLGCYAVYQTSIFDINILKCRKEIFIISSLSFR